MGQLYEALGDIDISRGLSESGREYYGKSRDMYVETFARKNNRLSSEPPFDYSYFLLGRIYDKLGDTDRALRYYRELITESHYSNNTDPYQKAREAIHEITGVWEGSPPDSTRGGG